MALTIAVRDQSAVFIANRRFIVSNIEGTVDFELIDHETGAKHRLRQDRSVQVAPEVKAFTAPRSTETTAYVGFEAPRRITIVREALHGKDH